MSTNSALLPVKISLTLQKRKISKWRPISMKKYDRYLFFVSLVMAFLCVAAMPGIPGLVANIHAAEPFDGIPVFSAGTPPSSSASSALPPGCAPAQIDKVGASGYDLEIRRLQHNTG